MIVYLTVTFNQEGRLFDIHEDRVRAHFFPLLSPVFLLYLDWEPCVGITATKETVKFISLTQSWHPSSQYFTSWKKKLDQYKRH